MEIQYPKNQPPLFLIKEGNVTPLLEDLKKIGGGWSLSPSGLDISKNLLNFVRKEKYLMTIMGLFNNP